VGREKALLFDTGYGIGNIIEAVKSVTDKPLTVVLGHGHIDHANGAYQFNDVYIDERDNAIVKEHCSPEYRDLIITDLIQKKINIEFDRNIWRYYGTGNLKKLDTETIFNLGDINAKVVDMAGHTKGSIGLLIPEKKALLTSDGANEHCWMFLNESLSLKEYIAMLERVSKLDFDVFFTAHSNDQKPKGDFAKYIQTASNATMEKAVPYSAHKELKPYIYTENGVSVVFNKRTLGL